VAACCNGNGVKQRWRIGMWLTGNEMAGVSGNESRQRQSMKIIGISINRRHQRRNQLK
jgi:hypothetical protein